VRYHARPDDANLRRCRIAQVRPQQHEIQRKKKLRKSLPKAAPRRPRGRESSESASTDSRNRLTISPRKPLDKVRDVVIAASIHHPGDR